MSNSNEIFESLKFNNDSAFFNTLQSVVKEFVGENLDIPETIKIGSLNEVEPISSETIDIQGLKLISLLSESFSCLYYLRDYFYNDKIIHEQFSIAFYKSNWQIFYDKFREISPNANGLICIKEFLRANNEYCNIMTENFKYRKINNAENVSMLKIIPIVYLPERPPIVSAGDVIKDLRVFLGNPAVLPTQIVYAKKDNDDVGTVLIKTALTIIRATFGIKGLNLKRDIKSAIKRGLQDLISDPVH